MQKWIVSLALVFLVEVASSHPLHLSVTTVEISDTTMHLLIKVFQDDFLNLLHSNYGDSICYDDTTRQVTKAIQSYIESHLLIESEKIPVTFQLKDFHIEDVSLWINLTAETRHSSRNMTIQNTLFTDWFNDQKNLVIVTYGDQEQGLEFNTDKTRQSLTFNAQEKK